MAEDQVLADLQRTFDASHDSTEEESLAQLEELAKDHQESMDAIVREYREKRAPIEAQIAARFRDAEIERIKAGIQPTPQA